MLEVLAASIGGTVQDLGRTGYASLGVPPGGALDRMAFTAANILAGNAPGEAALELPAPGYAFRFLSEACIAVTGADYRPHLGGRELPMGETVRVPPGGMLHFSGSRGHGCRAYLAVAGGIEVPEILGSRSTCLNAGFGGCGGRALRRGDLLTWGSKQVGMLVLRPGLLPKYRDGAVLRYVPGPRADACDSLAGRRYSVTPAASRMGLRLEGPRLAVRKGDQLSEGVTVGAVQVPPDGQPIVLLADHQTTGGYAVPGVVIGADLDLAGQLKPGDWVRFEPVSLRAAGDALRVYDARLSQLARGAVPHRRCWEMGLKVDGSPSTVHIVEY